MNCVRCGHPQDWHRVDDADPSNYGKPETWKTRCIGYDCEVGGQIPVGGCKVSCPDFVPNIGWYIDNEWQEGDGLPGPSYRRKYGVEPHCEVTA